MCESILNSSLNMLLVPASATCLAAHSTCAAFNYSLQRVQVMTNIGLPVHGTLLRLTGHRWQFLCWMFGADIIYIIKWLVNRKLTTELHTKCGDNAARGLGWATLAPGDVYRCSAYCLTILTSMYTIKIQIIQRKRQPRIFNRINHGIMGTGIPAGGLLWYRKWVPQQLLEM